MMQSQSFDAYQKAHADEIRKILAHVDGIIAKHPHKAALKKLLENAVEKVNKAAIKFAKNVDDAWKVVHSESEKELFQVKMQLSLAELDDGFEPNPNYPRKRRRIQLSSSNDSIGESLGAESENPRSLSHSGSGSVSKALRESVDKNEFNLEQDYDPNDDPADYSE